MTTPKTFSVELFTDHDIPLEKKKEIGYSFNVVAEFYNNCVFGSGKNVWIAWFWISLNFILMILYGYTSFSRTFELVTSAAIFIELVVNIRFGFVFCKKFKFAKFLLFYHDKYGIDTTPYMKYFHICTIMLVFVIGLLSLFSLLESIFFIENAFSSVFSTIVLCIILLFYMIVIGSSVYLCLIWCLQLMLIRQAIVPMIKQSINLKSAFLLHRDEVSAQTIGSYGDIALVNINPLLGISSQDSSVASVSPRNSYASFVIPESETAATSQPMTLDIRKMERYLLTFLAEMRKLSNDWQMNHIVRSFTGFVIGIQYLVHALELQNEHDYLGTTSNVIAVVIYFGVIWLTALVAGYVNDQYFKLVFHQLSLLYAHDNDLSSTQNQDTIGTITKLTAIRQLEGLHFAGVPMSLEKAFGIGSLLVSIVILVLKFF